MRLRKLIAALVLCALPCMAAAGAAATWTNRADMPTGKMALSTSVADGVIYAIGGRTGGSAVEVFASVAAYDPAADNWTTLTDMPTPRFWHASGVVDGIIYVVGGTSNPSNAVVLPLSTVEAYDPATDTWTTRAKLPTARYGLTISVVNGIIYAIGGMGFSPSPTVEAYDPSTDTWTTVAAMPTPRGWLTSSVDDGKVYVFGGLDSGLAGMSAAESYDPATNAWTTQSDMPTERGLLSASTVDGRIYVIGGSRGLAENFGGGSTVAVFDPATDAWTTESDLPTARARLSTSVVDGTVYAFGGGATWPTDAFTTVEALTPTDTKTAVSPTTWATIKLNP